MKIFRERTSVYEGDIIVSVDVCKKCNDKGYFKNSKGEYIECDCYATIY